MSSKTPISGLQEYVVRFNVGSMPKYDLVQVAGPCHDPTFYVKVTVGDDFATGCGRTKKEAKHAAAKAMYDELVRRLRPRASGLFQIPSPKNRDDTYEPKITPEKKSELPQFIPEPLQSEIVEPDRDVVITGNPIGELQELCVSRFWPLPVYQMEYEKGLPHRKLFTVSCKLSNIEEVGTGKSKKLAKRAVAFKMLLRMRNQSSVDSNPTRSPNGACRKEFPSPERMARAKDEVEQERQKSDQTAGYGGVIASYKVASEYARRPAAREAYHSVAGAMANLQLNQSRGRVNVNVNISITGRLAEKMPANSATALGGTGTVIAQPAVGKSPNTFFSTIEDFGDWDDDSFRGATKLSDSSSSDSSTGYGRFSQRIPENAWGGSSSVQTPRCSSGWIDPNESDYIEGGGYVTLEELCREMGIKSRNASLRVGNGGASPSSGTYRVPSENHVETRKDSPKNPTPAGTARFDLVMTNDTCDLKPSQRTTNNCDERWMYCLSKTYGGEDVDPLKGGKWMIFAKNCYVDEIWYKLKTSVESGDIWQAKVSWLDPKKKSHAIMVFTLDYEDVDDVIRVLDILEETGAKMKTSEIYYKTNYMTATGIYSGGNQKPWLYRSSDIRERAKTGNYNY